MLLKRLFLLLRTRKCMRCGKRSLHSEMYRGPDGWYCSEADWLAFWKETQW